jgi:hypothetical protein
MTSPKVVDIVAMHGRVQIVQPGEVPTQVPVSLGARGVASISTPWTVLLGSGAACVGLGLVMMGLFPFSLLGLVLTNLLFSAGAGLGVLALAKRATGAARASAAALPARVDPSLMAERSRRVRALLRDGPRTFERLLGELKWTQVALVSTLVHMKERGEMVEDLSLDTGEWVYTLAEGPDALSGSPSLAERQAQASEAEGHG